MERTGMVGIQTLACATFFFSQFNAPRLKQRLTLE